MSRTILITGASGGLGLALAHELLEYSGLMPDTGFVLQYRNNILPAGLRDLLDAHTGRVMTVRADLTDQDQAATLVSVAGKDLAGVVTLAGGNKNDLAENVTAENFAALFEQNVLTMHNVVRACLRAWDGNDAPGGRQIVTVSSVVAAKGAIGATPYAAVKAAIEGYTRSLALEVARNDIAVNCIRLGYFDAGLIRDVPESLHEGIKKKIAMRRFGDSGLELANVVRFLLDGTNYMTGQVLPVDGGML